MRFGPRPAQCSCRIPDSRSRHGGATRTRRRRGTPGSRRGAAPLPPARASGSTAPPSQRAEHPDDLAEDLHMARVDRLEELVLRLQPDAAVLAEVALDRRLVRALVLTRERDDDLAVRRGRLT